MIIWETAGEMIKDRPLTGVGASALPRPTIIMRPARRIPSEAVAAYMGGVYHAHQMYVSIAAESGINRLAGLLAAIAVLVRGYLQAAPGQTHPGRTLCRLPCRNRFSVQSPTCFIYRLVVSSRVAFAVWNGHRPPAEKDLNTHPIFQPENESASCQNFLSR